MYRYFECHHTDLIPDSWLNTKTASPSLTPLCHTLLNPCTTLLLAFLSSNCQSNLKLWNQVALVVLAKIFYLLCCFCAAALLSFFHWFFWSRHSYWIHNTPDTMFQRDKSNCLVLKVLTSYIHIYHKESST